MQLVRNKGGAECDGLAISANLTQALKKRVKHLVELGEVECVQPPVEANVSPLSINAPRASLGGSDSKFKTDFKGRKKLNSLAFWPP